ncbi:hypothetical protein LZ30DRAFT_652214 [Colletotrichum cereale]|nr:hypothetical protein LZ30DRAFT_652214 [Colletotrichum cereale]
MANRSPRNEDFKIAIICTLSVEYDAVELIFDEFWTQDKYPQRRPPAGFGSIQAGRIGDNNVILCLLPSMGKTGAAVAAARILVSYPGLELAILTGICGGVPSPGTDHEILLGDVVISNSVVHYDTGRQYPDRFALEETVKDSIGRPSADICAILAFFKTHIGLSDLQSRTFEVLEQHQRTSVEVSRLTHYDRPAADEDMLFESSYSHRHRDSSGCSCGEGSTCLAASTSSCTELQCDVGRQVLRNRLEFRRKRQPGEEEVVTGTQESRIHLGRICSSRTQLTSGELRDHIARRHGLIAFGTIGTGVMPEIPCIIVSGVCDYADGHHGNKVWQHFAAGMAASATRAFLESYNEVRSPVKITRTQHLIPYKKIPYFVGRSGILDRIRQVFRNRRSKPRQIATGLSLRVVLYGPAGIGKTQIALAYVYWLLKAHPKVSVFWVAARTAEGFRQAYQSIAEEQNIPGRDDPQVDIISLVKTWLERKHRDQWLMVVDDVEHTELLSSPQPRSSITDAHQATQADSGRYIPECRRGSILFITRSELTGLELAQGGSLLEVGKMSESEARQLFQEIVGTETHVGKIAALCVQLKHEPLAITQAAKCIRESNISIDEYLERFSVIADGYADRQREDGVSVPEASVSSDQLNDSNYSLIQWLQSAEKDHFAFLADVMSTEEQLNWEVVETENLGSTASSDSGSSASSSGASRLFSDKAASTKLSSLEEETNHTRDNVAGKLKVEDFYIHTETADNCPDKNDEIRSLFSGPEDIQSQDGSWTARWAVTTAAVSYLTEVLTEDPDLTPLYLDAAQRLEDHRFFRNHGRLLKRYYLSLRSQTPNQKQKTAIEFLRPRSHRALISRRVLEKLQSRDQTMRETVHATLPQDEERNLTLERYLNNVESPSKGLPTDPMETDPLKTAPDFDEDESSMDEEDYRGISALVDLEETRSFFVSGMPLARFKAEFQDFLNPGRERVKETPRVESSTPPERPKVLRWGARLSAWLFDLCSPPKPGHQRVRYTCECGDSMFLDVRELSPGGVGRFRERLARDGLANFAAAQDSTANVPSGLSPPPPAHLRSERSQSTASRQSSELESSSSTTRLTTSSASSWSDEPVPQEEPSTFQYLLVCVNQKSLPILIHIECSSFENDQYLCQKILENYRMIREGATWKTSFLFPISIGTVMSKVSRFLEEKTPSWLQWISRLFQSVSEISFFKMDSGDFVRFQLVPVGEAIVPHHFKCGEFPPCSEVKAGNYIYEPVPMVDVALASIPLWHLTRPGRHSDKYWTTTFPKKLRYPLRREAGVYGKPVIGWGIRVNECFNWNQFLFLILTVVVIIGAIMGTYLALKADDSSGFGLGAFLAAVAAIYIPYQYFAWKEKLD